MKKLLFLIIFFPCLVKAEGPLYKSKDVIAQQEFDNVYQDLRGLRFSTGTYILNSSNMQNATFNVSSGTINELITTTATIQNINGTFIGYGRNRVVNGAMRIDQRNEGTSLAATSAGSFGVDHWLLVSTQARIISNQISSATASNTTFHSQLFVTSSTVATSTMAACFVQPIEGSYIGDFGWGTSAAKSVTLSFLVKSSSAGVFSGAISNESKNRSYPFSYTVNVSSAWEYKSITIPGDTFGTWGTGNGVGIYLIFELGSGSPFRGPDSSWASANYLGVTGTGAPAAVLNSSWSITSAQLELGPSTAFEFRPDPIELITCLRYFQKTFRAGVKPAQGVTTQGALSYSATSIGVVSHDLMWDLFIPMRAAGTVTFYSPGASSSKWWNSTDGAESGASSTVSAYNSELRRTVRNAQAAGDGIGESISIHATFDAESGF